MLPFVIIHTTISWKLIPRFAPGPSLLIGAGGTISPWGNQSQAAETIPRVRHNLISQDRAISFSNLIGREPRRNSHQAVRALLESLFD